MSYTSARTVAAPEIAALSTPAGGFRSGTGSASLTPYSYGPDRTTGTCSKLPGGGGDETCHSSPRDRHGLPVSGSRTITVDQTKLITNSKIDPPRKNDEIDTHTFSGCRFSAYSNTLLGWPAMPTANSGKNVELNAMNMVQNCHLPSVLFSLIPIILGSQ